MSCIGCYYCGGSLFSIDWTVSNTFLRASCLSFTRMEGINTVNDLWKHHYWKPSISCFYCRLLTLFTSNNNPVTVFSKIIIINELFSGSLSAILAFACPLAHMITLMNASHLLSVTIQAFHFIIMQCVPTAEQMEAGGKLKTI